MRVGLPNQQTPTRSILEDRHRDGMLVVMRLHACGGGKESSFASDVQLHIAHAKGSKLQARVAVASRVACFPLACCIRHLSIQPLSRAGLSTMFMDSSVFSMLCIAGVASVLSHSASFRRQSIVFPWMFERETSASCRTQSLSSYSSIARPCARMMCSVMECRVGVLKCAFVRMWR